MRKSVFLSIGAMLLSNSLVISAATSVSVEIKHGYNQLKSALANLPYASQGKGPALYLFEFSESAHSQKLYRRYKGSIPGVEVRHVFYAVNQKTANETAALAMSRSASDYQAFMEKRRRAKAADSTQQSVDAFNSVMGPVNEIILPTLIKNGWRAKSLVSPTYFWEEDGKLYADGGYSASHFDAVLASVAGTTMVAAQASKKTEIMQAPAAEPKKVSATVADSSKKTFDILGVHLGMTIDEVRAAFKAYDPDARVTEKSAGIGYYDGVESKTIETYTSQLTASFVSKGNHLTVDFSKPPEGGRVIYVERGADQTAKFPPYESFKAALVNKYGELHLERKRKGSGGVMLWSFPAGKTMCLNTGGYMNMQINQRNYNLANPRGCSSLLLYSLDTHVEGGPVQRIKATLVDVAETIRTNEVSEAWRKKHEEEGRAARSAGSKKNALDL